MTKILLNFIPVNYTAEEIMWAYPGGQTETEVEQALALRKFPEISFTYDICLRIYFILSYQQTNFAGEGMYLPFT